MFRGVPARGLSSSTFVSRRRMAARRIPPRFSLYLPVSSLNRVSAKVSQHCRRNLPFLSLSLFLLPLPSSTTRPRDVFLTTTHRRFSSLANCRGEKRKRVAKRQSARIRSHTLRTRRPTYFSQTFRFTRLCTSWAKLSSNLANISNIAWKKPTEISRSRKYFEKLEKKGQREREGVARIAGWNLGPFCRNGRSSRDPRDFHLIWKPMEKRVGSSGTRRE